MIKLGSAFAALRERTLALFRRDANQNDTTVPVRDWIKVGSGQPARLQGFDQALVWVVIALLAAGMVMVYSASVALPDNPKFARYTPTHFLSRQMISIALALVVSLVVVQIPVAFWEKASPWIFVAALLLLVLVLIPFIGKGVNGARRWKFMRKIGIQNPGRMDSPV